MPAHYEGVGLVRYGAVGEGRASGSGSRAVLESPQRYIVCLGQMDGQAAE